MEKISKNDNLKMFEIFNNAKFSTLIITDFIWIKNNIIIL